MNPEAGAVSRIAELKERVEKDPKSRLFVQLAEEYRKAGQPGEAIAGLRRGLEHHPTYVAAWNMLGKLYVENGRDIDAAPVFERALGLDRENVVAARLLGDVCYRRGQFLDAIKRYKLARAISPGDDELDATIEALEKRLNEPGESALSGAVAAPELSARTLVSPLSPNQPASLPPVADDEASPFDDTEGTGGAESGAAPAVRPGADLESSDFWKETSEGRAAAESAPGEVASSQVETEQPKAIQAASPSAPSAASAAEEEKSDEDFRTAFIPSALLLAEMGRPDAPASGAPEPPPLPQAAPAPPTVRESPAPSSEEGATTRSAGEEDFPFDIDPPAGPPEVSQAEEIHGGGAPESTLTMADLYLRQGLLPAAREVLESLRIADPENPVVADRMSQLLRLEDEAARAPAFLGANTGASSAREATIQALRKWLNVIKKD